MCSAVQRKIDAMRLIYWCPVGRISAFAFDCNVQAVQCFTVLYLYVQRVAFGGTSAPRTPRCPPTRVIFGSRAHRAHTDTDTDCIVYCMQSHWRRRQLMRARKTKKYHIFGRSSTLKLEWSTPSSYALPYNTRSPHNNTRMSVLLASGSVLLASGSFARIDQKEYGRALHFKKVEYCTVYKQRTRLLKANSKVKS